MGSFSIWHWLVVLVIVLVLFGRGRVADIMGEFGKGLKSFKHGMNEDPVSDATPAPTPSRRIEGPQHEAKAVGETVETPRATDTTNN